MSKTVLLVDRADFFLELEKSIFQRTGARILAAHTGKEALDLVRHEKPDIVLLDLRLPDMNGDKVCAEIKKNPQTSGVAVLIVAASGNADDREKCRRAGCDDYLSKPIRNQELLSKVAQLLNIPRRHAMRILVRIETRGVKGSSIFFGTSADLSKSGMFFETDQKLSLGDVISVSFFLPTQEEIETRSQVVREETRGRNNGYGIRFVSLTEKEEKALVNFIEKRKR